MAVAVQGSLGNDARYRAALAVARRLREAGHQAYFAGGCVRDLLLGVKPKDYDVATSATPDEVIGQFAKTFAVGAHFGVVLVCEVVDGVEIATEVATFRNDGAYSDGRRPDEVRFSTDPREDVLRRDFTINGMLLDPEKYEATGDAVAATLDFVRGREDLTAGVVRAIGDPNLRFGEDKLRMLRAVRFAARLRFAIDPVTAAAICQRASEIELVSAERVRDELTRILTEGGAARGFALLHETSLLQQVLPEVERLRGVAQQPEFHPEGDVWVHTMLLLEKLPAGCSATLAWGALLHDIGKPATYQPPNPTVTGDRIRFNGHVEVGVAISAEICRRFRFSNDETRLTLALVENHMRFGDAPRMKSSTLKRFFRLEEFDQHLALHRMDCMAARGNLEHWEFVRERYAATPAEAVRPRLLVTGRELIAAGYRPGAGFKQMLRAAEDAQLEGQIETVEEAIKLIRERFPVL